MKAEQFVAVLKKATNLMSVMPIEADYFAMDAKIQKIESGEYTVAYLTKYQAALYCNRELLGSFGKTYRADKIDIVQKFCLQHIELIEVKPHARKKKKK